MAIKNYQALCRASNTVAELEDDPAFIETLMGACFGQAEWAHRPEGGVLVCRSCAAPVSKSFVSEACVTVSAKNKSFHTECDMFGGWESHREELCATAEKGRGHLTDTLNARHVDAHRGLHKTKVLIDHCTSLNQVQKKRGDLNRLAAMIELGGWVNGKDVKGCWGLTILKVILCHEAPPEHMVDKLREKDFILIHTPHREVGTQLAPPLNFSAVAPKDTVQPCLAPIEGGLDLVRWREMAREIGSRARARDTLGTVDGLTVQLGPFGAATYDVQKKSGKRRVRVFGPLLERPRRELKPFKSFMAVVHTKTTDPGLVISRLRHELESGLIEMALTLSDSEFDLVRKRADELLRTD